MTRPFAAMLGGSSAPRRPSSVAGRRFRLPLRADRWPPGGAAEGADDAPTTLARLASTMSTDRLFSPYAEESAHMTHRDADHRTHAGAAGLRRSRDERQDDSGQDGASERDAGRRLASALEGT